jgi:hypothetical protein
MYVNPLFRRRPASLLGDASSTQVQLDTADVLSIGGQLRDAQSRLTNLLAQMRNDADLARAIGRDVTAQQAALGDLTAKYVGVYTAIFGQAPVGLGNPIVVAAAVAVILSYVVAQLYLWHQKQDVLDKQAQAQILAEQNRASIIDMAQQKQDEAAQKAAAGDAQGAADARAAAAAMLTQAGVPGGAVPPPPGTPQSLSEWIKANWIPVVAVGAAIFIVPRMMDR